ncbi:hypothetical protein IQ07DRAFT_602071 [Pyrenochaeta sp. DS3sAY3a]|nr:hypothetical protein IQ07DRAFT_602071 [Pyrenochaeta sp. DS3sAY3a]
MSASRSSRRTVDGNQTASHRASTDASRFVIESAAASGLPVWGAFTVSPPWPSSVVKMYASSGAGMHNVSLLDETNSTRRACRPPAAQAARMDLVGVVQHMLFRLDSDAPRASAQLSRRAVSHWLRFHSRAALAQRSEPKNWRPPLISLNPGTLARRSASVSLAGAGAVGGTSAAVSLAMKQPGSACPNNVLAMHSIALVWPTLVAPVQAPLTGRVGCMQYDAVCAGRTPPDEQTLLLVGGGEDYISGGCSAGERRLTSVRLPAYRLRPRRGGAASSTRASDAFPRV